MIGPAQPAVRVRVLHVEDDPLDSELVRDVLDRDGIDAELHRVDAEDAYVRAIESGAVDVILSDFSLPSFDGETAVRIARARVPGVPFIFVSGTMGEETAVEALKLGAVDYVLKHRLQKLPAALRRALLEAGERSARREAEARLRESEDRFRRFMDATPMVAFLKDAAGRLVYVNRAAAQFLGKPAEALVGRTEREIFDPAVAAPLRAHDEQVLRSGELLEATEMLPATDGTPHHWTTFKFALRDASGRPLVAALAIDVTERRRLEERYLHAQKLEAVGRLASGVAHDFNNILTVIDGYAQMTEAAVRSDARVRGYVAEIRGAAARAASLTRQLLAFSRQEVAQPVVLDVNDAVRGMEKMIRRLLGEELRFEMALSPGPRTVRIDRGQLEQVLMNLVVNARDATPPGGLVRVRTGAPRWEEVASSADADAAPGTYVALVVEDTGVGMSPETMGRIFEPFFTTKDRGKGTGLGLATVHGIVKQNGGYVVVRSAVGAGSSFQVHLPYVEGQPTSKIPMPPLEEVVGGTETVLVAEDSHTVRSLICRILGDRGYHVVDAADGAEALQALRALDAPPDLLVSDVVMPHVNGPDLADALRKLHPDVPVLFVSGYADHALAARVVERRAHVGYLKKPFSAVELLRRVRELIDARRSV